jgi:predicted nucleic acid-binding protein
MYWLIDTDILIEGERGNPGFGPWFHQTERFATCEIVRGEFLLGVHSVSDARLRERSERFYRDVIAGMTSLPNEPADYVKAATLAGEARRLGKGKPSLIDGLIAALALRTGAKVATRNVNDFKALGCSCENPLQITTS